MRNKRIVCQAAIDNPELEQDANHNMRVHQFLRRSGAIPGQRNPPPRGSSYLGRMDTNQRRSLVGSLREDPTAFQSLVEAVQGSQDSPFLAPHHAFQASIPAGRGTTQRGSPFTWTPPPRGRGRGRGYRARDDNHYGPTGGPPTNDEPDVSGQGGDGFTFLIEVLMGDPAGGEIPPHRHRSQAPTRPHHL